MHTQEFDRQVATLLAKNYPQMASLSEAAFLKLLEPLRAKVAELPVSEAAIPFVIVIKSEVVSPELAMPKVEVKNKEGVVDMNPLRSSDFQSIEGLNIPSALAYLLVDIDTGHDTLNITPAEALKIITDRNRQPLTIDEGMALVTHFPEVLANKETFNAFSMLGSRRNDKRVPALWISYGQPRLGWCWNENPHTWLGSASSGTRIG